MWKILRAKKLHEETKMLCAMAMEESKQAQLFIQKFDREHPVKARAVYFTFTWIPSPHLSS